MTDRSFWPLRGRLTWPAFGLAAGVLWLAGCGAGVSPPPHSPLAVVLRPTTLWTEARKPRETPPPHLFPLAEFPAEDAPVGLPPPGAENRAEGTPLWTQRQPADPLPPASTAFEPPGDLHSPDKMQTPPAAPRSLADLAATGADVALGAGLPTSPEVRRQETLAQQGDPRTVRPAPSSARPTEAKQELLVKLREAFGLNESPENSSASLDVDARPSPLDAGLPTSPRPVRTSETLPERVSPKSAASGVGTPDQVRRAPIEPQSLNLVCIAHARANTRSQQLELFAREADRHTRRGFELAGRGAYFSARAEFIMALRILAQGLDAQQQSSVHSDALAAALTALKEAGDFIPTGSRLEAELDVPRIVDGHRTPVLSATLRDTPHSVAGEPSSTRGDGLIAGKSARGESVTPLAALRCYLTFAQEHLATAAGNEVAGSMALDGLGNLHRALATKRGTTVRAAMPKAVAFYQAAILVDPGNYLAWNELGVLLARAERYEDARVALEHGVSVSEQPATLHNLAVVYGRLGRPDLAQQSHRRLEQARAGRHRAESEGDFGLGVNQVRWIDPSTFARSLATPPAIERPAPPVRPSLPEESTESQPAPYREVARPTSWNPQAKTN